METHETKEENFALIETLLNNKAIRYVGKNSYYDAYCIECGLDRWLVKIHGQVGGKSKKGKEKYIVTLYHFNLYNTIRGDEYHIQFRKEVNAYWLSRYLSTHRYNRQITEAEKRRRDPVGYALAKVKNNCTTQGT